MRTVRTVIGGEIPSLRCPWSNPLLSVRLRGKFSQRPTYRQSFFEALRLLRSLYKLPQGAKGESIHACHRAHVL